MDDLRENVIEFLQNEKIATVTFTQGRYITRIKNLAKEKPDECQITRTNRDGSIVAHIPVSWVRIKPNMELSDERREELSERMRQLRAEQLADVNEGFMNEPEYPFYED